MLLVALAAVLVCGMELSRRSRQFASRARSHSEQAAWARQLAATALEPVAFAMNIDGTCETIYAPDRDARHAKYLELAGYHSQLFQKYSKLANHPWHRATADQPPREKLPPIPPPPVVTYSSDLP